MADAMDDNRSIFHAALSFADPAKRAEYLAVACGNNTDLRKEVESLLAAHQSAGNFMRSPAVGQDQIDSPLPEEGEPSQIIGKYKLLQKLGEGGFGVVYMAEQQEPVIRKVALKIIKLGMDTKQVIARFEAERQALAMMDHPNIAKVLDAGATETGRPYFVMELVRGVPMLKYCDEKRLTNDQRLRLFMDICAAIQHAHQKGIIHRDIKPTNILATLHDGQPVPKVIDFGIVKATQQRLTDKTLFTRFEQFVGTPAYMSPEQAEMSGLDIDTRTDIYSLGVLLYELLTGRTPFDPKELSRVGYDEIRRRIREEEPPTPSTRLNSLEQNDLTTIAHDRQTDPLTLQSLLRGDLDWIVMKAMDKDRTRRYDTASALAEDVGRYLRHEPVSAVPPSVLYKLQKFARRNRGVFTAITVVTAILVLASTISIGQAIRATVARGRESVALENARVAERHANEKARAAQLNLYVSDMNLAHEAYQVGNVRRAIDLLSLHAAADSQDMPFEWRYLWQLCQQGDALTTGRYSSAVNSVALSDDGILAVGCDDGSVRLLHDDLKDEIAALDVGTRVISVAFKGARFVAATGDGDITMWDTHTWEHSVTLPNTSQQKSLSHVAFSRDGTKLAVASRSFGLKLLNAGELSEIRTLPIADSPAYESRCVAYSPVEDIVATTGPGLSIRFWDMSQLQELPSIEEAHKAFASAVAFSPDGKVLASGSWDTMVKLWNVATREYLATLNGHQATITSLCFSPEGDRLASASLDATVKLWDVESWTAVDTEASSSKEDPHDTAHAPAATAAERAGQTHRSVPTIESLDTLRGHTQGVQCVTFSPDGEKLVSASSDGTVKLWSPVGSPKTDILAGHDDWPYYIAFSPDDQTLATGSFGGTVRLWDTNTCQLKGPPRKAHQFDVFKVVFSPDGKWLASCDSVWRVTTQRNVENPGEVKLWNIVSGEEISIPRITAGVRSLAFSPDGNIVAIGERSGWLRLWDRRKNKFIVERETTDQTDTICFSPDGKILATADWWPRTKLWSVPSLDHRHTFDVPSVGVAFSADGKMIAAGSEPAVIVWNATTYEKLAVFEGHKAQVWSMAFSPDGKTLATGSVDHTVKLWNIEAGREVLTLTGHQGPVSCVVFSHDGNTLASSSEDKTVRLWRALSTDKRRIH